MSDLTEDPYLTGVPTATNLSATQAVAEWMIQHGYATGHGDTLDDLLTELVAHTSAPVSRS